MTIADRRDALTGPAIASAGAGGVSRCGGRGGIALRDAPS